MEEYICPRCERTSYTACRDNAQTCPYCDVEKFLILNPKFLSYGCDIADAKVLIDRRDAVSFVETERRASEDVELIPVAWLAIRNNTQRDNF